MVDKNKNKRIIKVLNKDCIDLSDWGLFKNMNSEIPGLGEVLSKKFGELFNLIFDYEDEDDIQYCESFGFEQEKEDIINFNISPLDVVIGLPVTDSGYEDKWESDYKIVVSLDKLISKEIEFYKENDTDLGVRNIEKIRSGLMILLNRIDSAIASSEKKED